MKNGFVSLLDHIGGGLKKFFTSPIAEDVEDVGLSIAEVELPGLTPLLTGIQASLAKARSLAAAANVQGDTTAQETALALSDAQQVFDTYQQTTGTTVETAQQRSIVQLFMQLLDKLPAPSNTAPAPAAVAPASTTTVNVSALIPAAAPAARAAAPAIVIGPQPTTIAPEAPGAAVAATVIDGPGLHNVVAP